MNKGKANRLLFIAMPAFKDVSRITIWKLVSNKIKPLDYLPKNKSMNANLFSLLPVKSRHIVAYAWYPRGDLRSISVFQGTLPKSSDLNIAMIIEEIYKRSKPGEQNWNIPVEAGLQEG